MSNPKWHDNAIQFSRLLAEIMATQQLDMPALAESMDISMEELNELFDRADQAWESAKAGEEAKITVNLNVFDDKGNVVDGTTAEMTLAQISDVVDHASQIALIRRSANRSSNDLDPILDELEEALDASGVI